MLEKLARYRSRWQKAPIVTGDEDTQGLLTLQGSSVIGRSGSYTHTSGTPMIHQIQQDKRADRRISFGIGGAGNIREIVRC